MAIRFSEAGIGKEENGHEKNEQYIYSNLYFFRTDDSVGYLYVGGGSMTALTTSLAWSVFPFGRRVLLMRAIIKCMREQYWK